MVEAPGFNKLVYSNNFLKSMKRRLREQIDDIFLVDVDDDEVGDGSGNVDGGVDLNSCLSAESIADMETRLIAPLYGFVDNVDYYRKTSCVYYLDGRSRRRTREEGRLRSRWYGRSTEDTWAICSIDRATRRGRRLRQGGRRRRAA